MNIVTAIGAYGPSQGWGYGFKSIGGHAEIDISNLPITLGKTPLGTCEWYQDIPNEYIFLKDSDRNDICPMRGSVAGIASLEASGRVNAYYYFMAKKAGARFAKWSKRTGKKVLAISGKTIIDTGHHRATEIVINNLESSANYAWGELEADFRFIQVSGWRNKSAIYCLNLSGLNDELKVACIEMAEDAARSEYIEQEIGVRP